ncbi:hypothetical protein BSKO_07975 [Bryopsis sp. KO-2023]|nr:hypothetical protein BSKO_07975 [Bryopsis sp. KO-2023]
MMRAVLAALVLLALGQHMAEACVNFGGKCGNISNSPFTYDPSRTGKKSGSGKKKSGSGSGSGKKKSGSGAFVPNFVPPTGIQTVAPGQTFTVATSGKSSTNIGPVEIHTSCSDPLGIGQTFCGLLEIVGGTNTQGTSLCPVTQPQRKSKCSSFG